MHMQTEEKPISSKQAIYDGLSFPTYNHIFM
jgi:hypothetical protein